jgi:hypothetical protein
MEGQACHGGRWEVDEIPPRCGKEVPVVFGCNPPSIWQSEGLAADLAPVTLLISLTIGVEPQCGALRAKVRMGLLQVAEKVSEMSVHREVLSALDGVILEVSQDQLTVFLI